MKINYLLALHLAPFVSLQFNYALASICSLLTYYS
jgi:hypothetical protein